MIIYDKENNGFSTLIRFINEQYDANTIFDLEFKFIYDNETITAKYDTMYETDNGLEDDEDGYEEYNAIAFLNIQTDELFEINYLNLPKSIICEEVKIL